MKKVIQFLFYVSAIVLLVGAASRLFLPDIYSFIYLPAAVVFAITQFLLRVKHDYFTVRRLVAQQQLGGLMLVAAGVLMFTHTNNEWMAIMLCGAFIELYTAFRIPNEIEKHK